MLRRFSAAGLVLIAVLLAFSPPLAAVQTRLEMRGTPRVCSDAELLAGSPACIPTASQLIARLVLHVPYSGAAGDVDLGAHGLRAGSAAISTTLTGVMPSVGNSGTSKTIDWTTSNQLKIVTTGSCTLTFTAPPGPASLLLKIVHDNTANVYTYTWPATVHWVSGGQAPATTNSPNANAAAPTSWDIISLVYDGDGQYTGSYLLNVQ